MNTQEFTDVLTQEGLSAEEAAEIFKHADRDKTNRLSYVTHLPPIHTRQHTHTPLRHACLRTSPLRHDQYPRPQHATSV